MNFPSEEIEDKSMSWTDPNARLDTIDWTPGTRFILTRCFVHCSKCGVWIPIRKAGLRKMGDGSIRNQPRCGKCRSIKG